MLYPDLSREAAMQVHAMNSTEDFQNPREVIATYEKIQSTNELPLYQDVIDLILFSEVTAGRELHERVFGYDRMMSIGSDIGGLNGGFSKQGIHHLLNHEFVSAIAQQIRSSGSDGTILEVAAGSGKLSYWLQEYGIPVIATDIAPKSCIVHERDCDTALKYYEPTIVISSWLDIADVMLEPLQLQKSITETESVQMYIEIGCVDWDYIGDDFDWQFRVSVDRSGRGSPEYTREVFNEAQQYSIPIDIFERHTFKKKEAYQKVLEQMVEDPRAFMMKHPSIFVWERSDKKKHHNHDQE